MSLLSRLNEGLRGLLFRGRTDVDMDDEMRFHIEREVEERVRRGANPATARRDAMVAFGGIERRKEEVRDARGTRAIEEFTADLRHALRALRRAPVFTIAAIVVLALGIGAASAVFGIADAVLISELPYRQPDRIVRIYQKYSATNMFGLSVVDVQAIAEQQRSFDAFGYLRPGAAALVAPGRLEQRGLIRASSGFFTVLGVTPAAGRLVQPGDEVASAEPVLVASHALAVRWFGDAPSAVGKTITVDGLPHTVIGVLPAQPDNLVGMRPSVVIAMKVSPPPRRGPFGIRAFARLKDGVTLDAATRDLAGISDRIFPVWKSSFRDSTTKLTPVGLRDAILGDQSERQVGLLAAGVALVLLVAIANVALLMLVRVSAREPELAVRSALGAGRWRLARLLAAESVVLGVAAAVAGFALASLLLKLAPELMPTLPRIRDVAANTRVAALAAVGALVAALLASAAPVLSVLARRVNTSINASRRTGASRQSDTARSLLVAAEFGLALPLLFGAGLLLNSFLRLQRLDPGYDPDDAVAVSIGLPLTRYTDSLAGLRFWNQLEQRVRESPAFASAGLSGSIPPTEPGDINNFDLKDRPVPPGGVEHLSPWVVVTNGYFETLRIPLLEGRLFTLADTGVAPVVVVSRAWARKYYPDVSAVGKQLIGGGCTTCPLITVVGVVGDVKYQGLAESSDAVYEPVTQALPSSTNLVARTRGGAVPAATFAAIRDVVASLDPEIPVTETTLRETLDESLSDPRRWASMLGAFSITTVVLATVGIFGLMAYTVRQRRREIGVRMALGAQESSVVWMIIGKGMRYAIAGSVAGAIIALVGGRWIRSFLFDVSASDPLTLVGVTVVLLVAAAFACWMAARRAANIHPVEAIASD